MSNPSLINAIGIIAKNSTGYVNAVFEAYNNKKTFVSLKNTSNTEDILGVNVEEVIDPSAECGWINKVQNLQYFDDIAQISYTSGTEGEPKGILLSHKNLANVIERLNKVMKLDASVREYVGVPVLHSFGLARVRACAAVGGASYIPKNGFNPLEIAEMLEAGKINAISAVPTLWRILLANVEVIGTFGEKVKWIEIGSQFMSRDEKVMLKSIFPNANIIQHYGLTEASRSTFLDITNADESALSSVGVITDEVEIFIDENDLINIKGEHVAKSYLHNGSIYPLTNEDGFLVTNDLGEIKNGQLYFNGRADDIINCGGVKVSPDIIERKLAKAINISSGFTVARFDDPLRGDGILVACEAGLNMPLKIIEDNMKLILNEQGVNIGNSIKISEVSSLPKTNTGKIKRSSVSSSYLSKNASTIPNTTSPRNTSDGLQLWKSLKQKYILKKKLTVLEAFRSQFNTMDVSMEDSFVSLGGDSLNYITMMVMLEQILGELPGNWENKSINNLSQIKKKESLFVSLDTTILLRFLSITLIVCGHFGLITYGGGGAYLLLVIGGYNFANFQLRPVVEKKKYKLIFNLMLKIAVPTIGYLLLVAIILGNSDYRVTLLISNFFVPGLSESISYWYIEVYLQIILIMFLLLSIKFIRQNIKKNSFNTMATLSVLSILLFIGSQGIWDTHYLYRRVPQMLLWMFVIGMTIKLSDNWYKKIISTVLFLMATLLFREYQLKADYFVICGLVLIWVPVIKIPFAVKKIVTGVASASLFIYLTHFQFKSLSEKIIGQNEVFAVVLALIGGTLIWNIYNMFVVPVSLKYFPKIFKM